MHRGGPITDVTITSAGIGPQENGCAAYGVTEDQVRKFFAEGVLSTLRLLENGGVGGN